MRPRFICFVILTVFILSATVFFTGRKENDISQITIEDQKILSAFFEILLKQSPAGFTLFGDKPISFHPYILPHDNEAITKKMFI